MHTGSPTRRKDGAGQLRTGRNHRKAGLHRRLGCRRHDLTTGPGSHRAEHLSLRTTSSELTRPRACALQQEQPAQRSWSVTLLATTGEKPPQQQRHSTTKISQEAFFFEGRPQAAFSPTASEGTSLLTPWSGTSSLQTRRQYTRVVCATL